MLIISKMISISILLYLLAVPLFAETHKKILLQDVQTLTFYKGAKTKARRLAPVAQLQCVGGTASDEKHYVDSVQCYNRGFDGVDFNWECVTQIPDRLVLGKVEVVCEGFKDADDQYILAGSCALEYELNLADTKSKRVLLSDLGFLTFRDGMTTTTIRQKPQAQMQCIGGSAPEVSNNQANKLVKEIKCVDLSVNNNYDFKCIANLPANYKLGWTEVVCEGYDYPEDPYVVDGSCYVRYYLDYQAPKHQQSVLSLVNMLWLFVVYTTLMMLGMYMFCWECFYRRITPSANHSNPVTMQPRVMTQSRVTTESGIGRVSLASPTTLSTATSSSSSSSAPAASSAAASAAVAAATTGGGSATAASSAAAVGGATTAAAAEAAAAATTVGGGTAAAASAAAAATTVGGGPVGGAAVPGVTTSTTTSTTGTTLSTTATPATTVPVFLVEKAVPQAAPVLNHVVSQNQATNVVIHNIIVNHEPNLSDSKGDISKKPNPGKTDKDKLAEVEDKPKEVGEKVEIKESVSYGKTRRR